jgi:cell division protein FtsW (lipid II flippase)
MKIALILLLSKFLYEKRAEMWNFINVIKTGIFVGLPCVLALLQPDLGSVIIMFLI